jgi:hypothetical protein
MKQFLIAFDQLINTVFGGYADETISARSWRTEQDGKLFGKFFRPLIDTILFFDKDHCYNSYVSEKRRKQFPDHYRNI